MELRGGREKRRRRPPPPPPPTQTNTFSTFGYSTSTHTYIHSILRFRVYLLVLPLNTLISIRFIF